MDSTSLNHYEERLYSVFKTFDVNNEEALNRAAVLALCDALQLEARGAALVDTLFERERGDRDQRVTFAQFRGGLLAVLGDPAPPPAAAPSDPPPHSDDDSSGREVAPKFVFGSKKYGRRSRPCRSRSAQESPPASSPAPAPAPAESPLGVELDHSSRVDCERALQLCRRLQMDGIDRRLVEHIFDAIPGGETTVGQFFDRLNASLSNSIDNASASVGALGTMSTEASEEEVLPTELVVEAWERAGVQRARRLLAELGFEGAALPAGRLERALDDEAGALASDGGAGDARGLLLLAALALARLRRERADQYARDAAAERDRLRADVEEANRRARILAQEVDENHAKLEAELTANLRRTEARHADALRRLEAERAGERERAAGERAALEAEVARRADAEQQLRGELEAQRERGRRLEERAAAAERRADAAEREGARLAEEARAAAGRAGGAAGEAERAAEALRAHADELRAENSRLRDRCDELCALLEARDRPPPAPASPPHTWHEEAIVTVTPHLEVESPPVSLEPLSAGEARETGEPLSPREGGEVEVRAQLEEERARHRDEKQRLEELVKELEVSLEAMREEYERCEEYWGGKLREERALLAEEQRAGDARLRHLADKISEYERQFAAEHRRLPTLHEAPALEQQAAEVEAGAAEVAARRRRVAAREEELARRERAHTERERALARLAHTLHQLARNNGRGCAGAGGAGGACGAWGAGGAGGAAEGELRARLARAEAGAARLAARLAAADLLVKDLYVENCRLAPAAHAAPRAHTAHAAHRPEL